MTDWQTKITPLTPDDLPAMIALEDRVLAALPDRRWYFPSTAEVWRKDMETSTAVGIWQNDTLIALAFARVAVRAGDHAYALKVGASTAENTLDFCDVMVDPSARRQGIHTAFHQFVIRMAQENHCHSIYATVDPENIPSRASFEKQGYKVVCQKNAYDGRPRVYYRLDLS